MKCSELIHRLVTCMKDNGDVPVVIVNDDMNFNTSFLNVSDSYGDTRIICGRCEHEQILVLQTTI